MRKSGEKLKGKPTLHEVLIGSKVKRTGFTHWIIFLQTFKLGSVAPKHIKKDIPYTAKLFQKLPPTLLTQPGGILWTLAGGGGVAKLP